MAYPTIGTPDYHRKLNQIIKAAKGKYCPKQIAKEYAKLCSGSSEPVRSCTSINKRDMPKNCREMQPSRGRSNDPKQFWNTPKRNGNTKRYAQ